MHYSGVMQYVLMCCKRDLWITKAFNCWIICISEDSLSSQCFPLPLYVTISGTKWFGTTVVSISILLIIRGVCQFNAESKILDFSSLLQAHFKAKIQG